MSTAIIHDTIWTGRMARALRQNEPVVTPRGMMFYLLTCPEKNPYGLFSIEMPVLGLRLNGDERDFFHALSVLSAEGFCRWDAASGWVWVIEMAHYQFQTPLKPGDYRGMAAKKWYRSSPRNVFIGPWFDRYKGDFRLEEDPHAVERRHYEPFIPPPAPTPPPLAVPLTGAIPAPAPGGASPLSTVRTLGFDLSSPEDQEPRSLLPVDPETRRLTKAEADAAFEALWPLYPNGKQKKDARAEFEKIKPTPALCATIRASIIAHATTHDWQKDAGQFVPRMVNWLKREGWKDRVDTPKPVVNERTSATLRAAQGFVNRFGGPDE
jgi:hypothetical protein